MRRLFVFIVFHFSVHCLYAQFVSLQEAESKAKAFVLSRQTRGSDKAALDVSLAFKYGSSRAVDFYAFNIGRGQGFAIVSGDCGTEDILAYADSGEIDLNDMPDGMSVLLRSYQQELSSLRHATSAGKGGTLSRGNGSSNVQRHMVTPLVKAQWNQMWPYNLQCPVLNGKHTPTGCVATAMAQIMYTQQCPAIKTTCPVPADKYERNELGHEQMPWHAFRWNMMTDNYQQDSNNERNEAIAYLMRLCGAAVKMEYTAQGSSAPDNLIVPAMVNYFGYDADARLVIRDYYTTEEWNDMIYQEVAAGRPVIYVASSPTDGSHAFVCDGYQKGDYFHINWGWGGSHNGFFRLSVLNAYAPDGLGNTEGYTIFHSAAVGLQPENNIVERPLIQVSELNFDKQLISRQDVDQDFPSIACTFSFKNIMAQPLNVEMALGLYVNGKLNDILFSQEFTNLPAFCEKRLNLSLKPFGHQLGDVNMLGAIVPLCRKKDNSEWMKCTNTDAFISTLKVKHFKMGITRGDMPHENPKLAVVNLQVIGSKIADDDQFVRVVISNTGGSFSDRLYFCVNGKIYGYTGVYLPAGAIDSVAFTFRPQQVGRYVFSVENAQGIQLCQGKMDIVATDIGSLSLPDASQHDKSPDAEKWFDLSGRRIVRPNLPGIYIFNGRKIIVSQDK